MTNEALLRDSFAGLLHYILDEGEEALQREILRIIRCDTLFSSNETIIVQTEADAGSGKIDISLFSANEGIASERYDKWLEQTGLENNFANKFSFDLFSSTGRKKAGLELKVASSYNRIKLREQLQMYKDSLLKYEANRLVLIAPTIVVRYADGFRGVVDDVVFWEQVYQEIQELRKFWSGDSRIELVVARFTRTLERTGLVVRKRLF